MTIPESCVPQPDPEPESVARQWDRRRAAAVRLPLLPDGRRDPLELPAEPVATMRELDAWACALAHLRSVGLAGLPPVTVRRAMASCGDRYAAVMPRRRAA
jgi:hypothetical protein